MEGDRRVAIALRLIDCSCHQKSRSADRITARMPLPDSVHVSPFLFCRGREEETAEVALRYRSTFTSRYHRHDAPRFFFGLRLLRCGGLWLCSVSIWCEELGGVAIAMRTSAVSVCVYLPRHAQLGCSGVRGLAEGGGGDSGS